MTKWKERVRNNMKRDWWDVFSEECALDFPQYQYTVSRDL